MIALVASAITYRVVENPVRFSRALLPRPVLTVGLGLVVVASTLAVGQLLIQQH
jgi:hypothetical protein